MYQPVLAFWRRLSGATTPPKTGMSTGEELYNFIQGKENLVVEEDEESVLKRLWKNLAWNKKKFKPCQRPVLAHWRRLSGATTPPETGMSTGWRFGCCWPQYWR